MFSFLRLVLPMLMYCATAHAQSRETYLVLEGSKGSGLQYSVAISYNYVWRFGKQQKFELGTGARLTYYSGGPSRFYFSAPASIASGGNENIDTVLVNSPSIYSLNLMLNFGYRFTKKISAGFNIDLIGGSFGNEKLASYIGGVNSSPAPVRPTSFNLLQGDNYDHGNLNSTFFVRYHINPQLAVKAGVQHLFSEYTTSTEVQQLPSPNDRFRYKSTMFSAGILFYF